MPRKICRLERSRKRDDFGQGIIKICILGILSSEQFEDGGNADKISRALPRVQSPDRMKMFLEELIERGLIQPKDLSHAHAGLMNYKIKEEGKRVLEKYFDQEFRHVAKLLEGVKGTSYLDLENFWQKYGKII